MALVVIAALLATTAHSQSWTRRYEAPGWQGTTPYLEPTPDGGFFYAASYRDGSSEIAVFKAAVTGEVDWAWTLDLDGVVNDLEVEPSGLAALVLARGAITGSPVITQPVVLKVDSGGSILWARSIIACDPARASFLESFAPTSDGGYVLVGAAYCGRSDRDLWILKVDSDWIIEWQRAIQLERFVALGQDTGRFVEELVGGGYLVLGSRLVGGAPFARPFVAVLDSGGNVVSLKILDMENWGFKGLARLSDGSFIAGASSGSISKVWTTKFLPDGTLDWHRYLFDEGSVVHDVDAATDGFLLAVNAVGGRTAIAVSELDGTIIRSRVVAAPSLWVGSPVTAAETDDGHFFLSEVDTSGTLQVMRLLPSMSLADATCADISDLDPAIASLLVPPINPDVLERDTTASFADELLVSSPLFLSAGPCAASCATLASPAQRLLAVKRAVDIEFSWEPDPGAGGYNLWYVLVKVDIPQAGLDYSPPAVGVDGCSVPIPSAGITCTDLGAISRDPAAVVFFYQIRTYCDEFTEGP